MFTGSKYLRFNRIDLAFVNEDYDVKLAEYRQLERHLAQQMAALEAMKGDKGLEEEIEFETKLSALLGQHNKSLRDVVAILDPQSTFKSRKGSEEPEKSLVILGL